MTETPTAGWYPDPSAQFEQRYWNGQDWTEHVASRATGQTTSPLQPAGGEHVRATSPEKVRHQVQQQAGVAPFTPTGGSTLFDASVLVVNQKAKLIEITNQYAVYDANGRQLGSVSEVGQNVARKALRLLSSLDQYLPHRYEVHDEHGRLVLNLRRPGKVIKSTVIVSLPDGREVGRIRQENAIGKIRFAYEVDGQRVGGIQGENWRAWDFAILDAQGAEVARIKKTWEGLARTMFTTADNYVIRIHRPLEEPLRTLVVASALTVDTALKQDARGIQA